MFMSKQCLMDTGSGTTPCFRHFGVQAVSQNFGHFQQHKGYGTSVTSVTITPGVEITVAEIPQGTDSLSVSLNSPADLDIKLFDPEDSSNCIAGYGCTLSGSPPTGASGEVAGMQIYFSGDMISPDPTTGLVSPSPATHAILTQLQAGVTVFQTHLFTNTVLHALRGAQPLFHALLLRQNTVWDTFGPRL